MKETRLEDMFNDSGTGMHDPTDMKRIILEGSKIGKNIIKKEEQLIHVKALLDQVSITNTPKDIKKTLIQMYKIYEGGVSLDNKVGRITTTDPIILLGLCYNYVAGKMETIQNYKEQFETEVQGY